MQGENLADRVVREVSDVYGAHRDPEKATGMAAYMRDRFPFLGLQKPARAKLDKEILRGLPEPTEEELRATTLALWKFPEREYQYFATGYVTRHRRVCSAAFIETAEELITTKSWWDTVDALAAHLVGGLVTAHPDLTEIMDDRITDENFWLARTAILHQLRYKDKTDADRLFAYCLQRAPDTEFFIRKAIGWALREYSKTDGAAVTAFVETHDTELSDLSKREARKWLARQRSKA